MVELRTRWMEVGEHPTLWKDIRLSLVYNKDSYSKDSNHLEIINVLGAKRFQHIQFLDLYFQPDNDQKKLNGIFQAVVDHPNVKHLNLRISFSLNLVTPLLLGKVFAKMKTINLDINGYALDKEHIEAIFIEIQKSSHLEKLTSNFDAIDIPEKILAKGIASIKEVDLHEAYLTSEQYNAILREAAKGESKLETLHCRKWRIEDISDEIVEQAREKIAIIYYNCTNMVSSTADDVRCIIYDHI